MSSAGGAHAHAAYVHRIMQTKDIRGGREGLGGGVWSSNGAYLDEAGRLLLSFLISFNLLIPILKSTKFHCCRLLLLQQPDKRQPFKHTALTGAASALLCPPLPPPSPSPNTPLQWCSVSPPVLVTVDATVLVASQCKKKKKKIL